MRLVYPEFESNDFIFARNFVEWYDFGFLFVYLGIFYAIAWLYKKRNGQHGIGWKYFYPALTLKILGGVFICLIYSYYYNGGDTTAYFNDARLLSKVFWNDPVSGLQIFFSNPKSLGENAPFFYNNFRFLRASDTYMVVRLSFLIQFFTFNSFLITSACFGFISFFFIWQFYQRMCRRFPKLIHQLALAILFIPGGIVWGSGIFKDTICLSLLYFCLCRIDQFIIDKRVKLFPILGLIVAIYLLIVLKIYIVLIFGFAFLLFLSLGTIKSIKNRIVRFLFAPMILFLGILGFYQMFAVVGAMSKRGIYSMENVLKTAEITGNYLQYLSERDNSSGYSLGKIDYTVEGLARKAPAAVNVTLFRPYLWEVKKPIMLFSAIESFVLLIFTLFVFIRCGLFRVFRVLYQRVLVFSFLTYSIAFSFAIGIATFNFGTLVRYKIPIMPFYIIALILIQYYALQKKRASH